MQKKYQILVIGIIILLIFSFKQKRAWIPLGPFHTVMPNDSFKGWSAHGNGRIFDLLIHPKNAKKIWACSPNGGLFYTKNRGKRWTKRPTPVPGGVTHICSQVFKNKLNIIIGSNISMPNRENYSFGIFKSNNNGKTWDTIKRLNPTEYNLSAINGLAATNNIILYAINKTIYKFQNNQETKLYDLDFKPYSIKINPNDDSEWFVIGEKLMHFSKNGKHVKRINFHGGKEFKAIRADLCFAKKEVKIVFHTKLGNYVGNVKNNEILPSRKTNISIDPNRTSIVYDSFRDQYLIGGIRLHQLNNEGKVSQITNPLFPHEQYVHDDIRAIEFDHKGNILLAHDAGVSISENNGKKWFNINGCGLNITEVYDLAISDENLVFGAQDLSSFIYNRKTKKWKHTSELYGDGGTSLITSEKMKILVMQGTFLMEKSKNGFNSIYLPTRASTFNPPIIAKNENLFFANKHLWQRNKDNKWKNLTSEIDKTYRIVDLKIDQNQILFAKTDPVWRSTNMKGKLYFSNDYGKNWKDLTANLPPLAYKTISSVYMNNDTFYATMASFDNPKGSKDKVFVSYDKGLNWKNISEGIPNIPCNDITLFNHRLYLATDIGAYSFNDEGNKWQLIEELPNAPIMKFTCHKNSIYAVTYGRGLWFYEP
jgi:photosystem II stability/assembly factor-like uncharacterized protein